MFEAVTYFGYGSHLNKFVKVLMTFVLRIV